MGTVVRNERGSVLIIAVIAMLIMGVLSVSFALLSNLETTIGFNYKEQAQAEALAEAGLERARDALRSAAAESCGFTRWTNPGAVAGCGSVLGQLLFNDVSLGGGTYSAVIDNDCNAYGAVVPTAIQQDGCPTQTDSNETAVVTAWASAGTGRARVRAILSVDNPWKHVCSNSSQDNAPGYCNEAANRNGNPTITPADPNDPNGPGAYDTLPTPTLGCSAIDPTLHGNNATCTAARKAVTGDRTLQNCDAGGQQYQGYFDCALTTPCPASICGAIRRGCIRDGDARSADTTNYYTLPAGGGPCGANTGMVFTASVDLPANMGAAGNGRNVYVLGPATWTIQGRDAYGTVVVEGDGGNGCTTNRDVWHKNGAKIWTTPTNTTHGQSVYGYPLAYLIYDPQQPVPTANPLSQQNTCADMGSAAGTEIHGIVYSGGNVEFNPIVVDGSVLAFQIQTQSTSATYGYNTTYGDAAPPPGFPTESGSQVVVVRKSFIVCTTYAADTGGATTACN